MRAGQERIGVEKYRGLGYGAVLTMLQRLRRGRKKVIAPVGGFLRKVMYYFPSSHYALLAIMFGVGLESISIWQRPGWVISSTIAVAVIMAVGVVLVRWEEESFGIHQMVLPILATLGLSGYTYLLPTGLVMRFYIVGASLILYFLLKHGARREYPLWNWVISLVVYFLTVSFIFGLQLYLYWWLWAVLALIVLVSSLMAWQALRRVADSSLDVILPALACGFVLAEVAWVIQFLPAHYLVQAGIVTTLYYVIFSLLSISYTRHTTRRDLLEYVTIGLAAIVIIVLSAQWK